MIKFLNIYINKIKSKKINFILDIIRIKNGWNKINYNNLKYFDIKINQIILINNMINIRNTIFTMFYC